MVKDFPKEFSIKHCVTLNIFGILYVTSMIFLSIFSFHNFNESSSLANYINCKYSNRKKIYPNGVIIFFLKFSKKQNRKIVNVCLILNFPPLDSSFVRQQSGQLKKKFCCSYPFDVDISIHIF